MYKRQEIYFAINPERPDIKEALDSAMRRIKDDNPFYTDDLYRRYLSAQSSSFLSKEEREWIGQHGAIRIGYLLSLIHIWNILLLSTVAEQVLSIPITK